MSTFDHEQLLRIKAAAESLTAEQQRTLAAWLIDQSAKSPVTTSDDRSRTAGLHSGAWAVADDFDAPLPEAFWLGNDA